MGTEPVSEACVHGVLDVRVGVHEARRITASSLVDGLAELLARPHGGDCAAMVVDLDGAVADRWAFDCRAMLRPR